MLIDMGYYYWLAIFLWIDKETAKARTTADGRVQTLGDTGDKMYHTQEIKSNGIALSNRLFIFVSFYKMHVPAIV